MLQLHTSSALTADLKPHLTAAPHDPRALQWHGHRVTLLQRRCVVLVESQSRYVMLLSDLSADDLATFPDLLRRRLVAEAVSLSDLDALRTARLVDLAEHATRQVQIIPGVDGRMRPFMDQMVTAFGRMVEEQGALPEDPYEAFVWGSRLNLAPQRANRRHESPYAILRGLWLELLSRVAPADNVVPFPLR